MKNVSRAPICWFGGKGAMLKKLLPLIPKGGHPYCEPFMGAASIFFARRAAPVEVLNDINGDLVNLFRCLQNKETYEELEHRLLHTPYSRAEFCRAIDILYNNNAKPKDVVLRAWAFFVNLNMGISGMQCKTSGKWARSFKINAGISMINNSWLMRLVKLPDWHKRLLCVQVDNRDALEVIKYWDNKDAVFYVDPPYVAQTRKDRKVYEHELDIDYYQKLMECLVACRGAVVLSGYDHKVYRVLDEYGWEKHTFNVVCNATVKNSKNGLSGKGLLFTKCPRVEVVWRNPRACSLCPSGKENRHVYNHHKH